MRCLSTYKISLNRQHTNMLSNIEADRLKNEADRKLLDERTKTIDAHMAQAREMHEEAVRANAQLKQAQEQLDIVKRERDDAVSSLREVQLRLESQKTSSFVEFEIQSLKSQLVEAERMAEKRQEEYQTLLRSLVNPQDEIRKELAKSKRMEAKWQRECQQLVVKLDFEMNRNDVLERKLQAEVLKCKESMREVADLRLLLHQTRTALTNDLPVRPGSALGFGGGSPYDPVGYAHHKPVVPIPNPLDSRHMYDDMDLQPLHEPSAFLQRSGVKRDWYDGPPAVIGYEGTGRRPKLPDPLTFDSGSPRRGEWNEIGQKHRVPDPDEVLRGRVSPPRMRWTVEEELERDEMRRGVSGQGTIGEYGGSRSPYSSQFDERVEKVEDVGMFGSGKSAGSVNQSVKERREDDVIGGSLRVVPQSIVRSPGEIKHPNDPESMLRIQLAPITPLDHWAIDEAGKNNREKTTVSAELETKGREHEQDGASMGQGRVETTDQQRVNQVANSDTSPQPGLLASVSALKADVDIGDAIRIQRELELERRREEMLEIERIRLEKIALDLAEERARGEAEEASRRRKQEEDKSAERQRKEEAEARKKEEERRAFDGILEEAAADPEMGRYMEMVKQRREKERAEAGSKLNATALGMKAGAVLSAIENSLSESISKVNFGEGDTADEISGPQSDSSGAIGW
ncbi:hypothetical protein BJ742DRAFT_164877 [Cladochytrium replicatum]|nr:hypothetical protein BJ742DRAFT_164877 [Cladochytrium replicatum]